MIDFQKIRNISLQIHVVFGFISLASFWFIIFLPKKTTTHKKLGYIYLLSIFIIMLTSITNYFILKIVQNLPYDLTKNADIFNYTFFTLISILAFVTTIIPIWAISQKNNIAELYQSDVSKVVFILSSSMIASGLIIGIFNFTNSILLSIYGLLLTPYMIIPSLIFLRKTSRQKITVFNITKFHILSLLKSGILLHVAFLTGGARVKYLKYSFDEVSLLGLTLALIVSFTLLQNKIVDWFYKKL